jgi:hypothetical protein
MAEAELQAKIKEYEEKAITDAKAWVPTWAKVAFLPVLLSAGREVLLV